MKLSECRIGEVVTDLNENFVGHIVGMNLNNTGEYVPIVEYPSGEKYDPVFGVDYTEGLKTIKRPIHYGNLKLLED